jgi:hypothetical protein
MRLRYHKTLAFTRHYVISFSEEAIYNAPFPRKCRTSWDNSVFPIRVYRIYSPEIMDVRRYVSPIMVLTFPREHVIKTVRSMLSSEGTIYWIKQKPVSTGKLGTESIN